MMRKDSTGYSAVRPAWDKQDCSVRALASAARTSHPRTRIEAAWKVTDGARGKMRKMEELMKELGA